MGDHWNDVWEEIDPSYVGDGCESDLKIQEYLSGLKATPPQVKAGFEFQQKVQELLSPFFEESRRLIEAELFGCCGGMLSRSELSELNYQESIRGDLVDVQTGVSVECQTAVTGRDASWEHSKRQRSRAQWQCFGFIDGTCLIVRTDAIREYLDRWNVTPNESRREGGRPYYSLSADFLRSIGAVDLGLWSENYRRNRPSSKQDQSSHQRGVFGDTLDSD